VCFRLNWCGDVHKSILSINYTNLLICILTYFSDSEFSFFQSEVTVIANNSILILLHNSFNYYAVQKSARYSVETQPILINPIQEDEKNTSVLFRGPN